SVARHVRSPSTITSLVHAAQLVETGPPGPSSRTRVPSGSVQLHGAAVLSQEVPAAKNSKLESSVARISTYALKTGSAADSATETVPASDTASKAVVSVASQAGVAQTSEGAAIPSTSPSTRAPAFQ